MMLVFRSGAQERIIPNISDLRQFKYQGDEWFGWKREGQETGGSAMSLKWMDRRYDSVVLVEGRSYVWIKEPSDAKVTDVRSKRA